MTGLWLVLLQGPDGDLYGRPHFVRASSGEEALARAMPTPPSTRKVEQALVVPVAGSWLAVPAVVPRPEWGNPAEYGPTP